jgi:hypothetical protein
LPASLDRFARTVAAQGHRPQATAFHCLGSYQGANFISQLPRSQEPKPFSRQRRRPAAEAANTKLLSAWRAASSLITAGRKAAGVLEDVSRDDVPFAVRVGLGVLVRGSCAGLGPRPAAFALAGVILGG